MVVDTPKAVAARVEILAEAEAAPPPALEAEVEPEPVIDHARLRRLAHFGHPPEVDRCALLGIDLDDGPRSAPHARPQRFEGEVYISRLAREILAAGVTADELEHAAGWLRSRSPRAGGDRS